MKKVLVTFRHNWRDVDDAIYRITSSKMLIVEYVEEWSDKFALYVNKAQVILWGDPPILDISITGWLPDDQNRFRN